jgi:hypothetical protein
MKSWLTLSVKGNLRQNRMQLSVSSLSVGDRVVPVGLDTRRHGIGTIVAIRTVRNIKLAAVKFESSHAAEFTELQLRKVL